MGTAFSNYPEYSMDHIDHSTESPMRKHIATLDRPTSGEVRRTKGVFRQGVPDTMAFAMGPFLRASKPVEEARKKFLLCKFRNHRKNPRNCEDEAMEYWEITNVAAELAMAKCPTPNVQLARCVEERKMTERVMMACRDELLAWDDCMESQFQGLKLPPHAGEYGWEPSFITTDVPDVFMKL